VEAHVSKGAQIAVGASIIALMLGWYSYAQLEGEGSYRYYQTLTEFRAAQAEIGDQPLRLHGYVVLESIERNVAEKHVRFAVQNDPPHGGGTATGAMPVFYQSLETPDLFKDGAEVVVEGRLVKRGPETVLVADNVMAKCPSKFEAMEAEGTASQPL
jgi:cytochrome c-type biogenesis protein CcmE